MDRKPLLWIVAVIVALIAGWQLASAQGEKEKGQKWEYKSIQAGLSEIDSLNGLGRDGWELVALDRYDDKVHPILCFKRPK